MKCNKRRLASFFLMAGLIASMTAGCGGSQESAETTAAQSAAQTEAGESSGAETQAQQTALPVSAVVPEVPAGESVSQETDVVAAMQVDFITMDPLDTSDTLSGGIQRLMMDGLFGFEYPGHPVEGQRGQDQKTGVR